MRPDNDIQAQAVPFKRRLFSPRALISVVVALALVALVATRFNQDWSATWSTIRSMDPWLYAAGFFLYYLSFAFSRTSLADAGAQRPNRRRAGSTAALDR